MRESTLVIGNWKMNLNVHEASLYVHKLQNAFESHRDVEVVLAPTMLALQSLSLQIDHSKFKLASQNFYWRDEGPYTGEVSAHQLRGLVKYAIIGHSDRRHKFGETDKDIRAKVQAAFRNDIIPVLCVGETASERATDETMSVLHDQLAGGLANTIADEVAGMVIAYEPVWALSHGSDFASHTAAKPSDAEKAIDFIRKQLTHLFGKKTAESVRVLYGGSTNANNASGFLTISDLDGFLVGGASLNTHEFSGIIKAAHERA